MLNNAKNEAIIEWFNIMSDGNRCVKSISDFADESYFLNLIAILKAKVNKESGSDLVNSSVEEEPLKPDSPDSTETVTIRSRRSKRAISKTTSMATTHLTLQRSFDDVQKFLNEFYSVDTSQFITFSYCISGDVLELAKVAVLLLIATVQWCILTANNAKLQSTTQLDSQVQEEIKDCLGIYFNERNQLLVEEIPTVLGRQVRKLANRRFRPEAKFVEGMIIESPLKEFIESPLAYKAAFQRKDCEVAKLRKSLLFEECKSDDLEKDLKKLQQQLDQCKRSETQIKERNKKLIQLRDDLEKANEALLTEKERCEAKIKELTEKIDFLTEDNEHLKKEYSHAQERCDYFQSLKISNENSLQLLQRENDNLKCQMNYAKQSHGNAGVSENENVMNNLLAEFQLKEKDRVDECRQIQAQLWYIEKENEALKTKLEEEKKENENLKDQMATERQAKAEPLIGKDFDELNEVEYLHMDVESPFDNKDELRKKLEAEEQKNLEIKEKFIVAEKNVRDLTRQNEILRIEKKYYEKKHRLEMENEIKKGKENVEKAEKATNEITLKYANAKKFVEKQLLKHKELSALVSAMEAKNRAREAEKLICKNCEGMEKELKATTKNITTLEKDKCDLQAAVKNFTSKKFFTDQEIQHLRKKVDELQLQLKTEAAFSTGSASDRNSIAMHYFNKAIASNEARDRAKKQEELQKMPSVVNVNTYVFKSGKKPSRSTSSVSVASSSTANRSVRNVSCFQNDDEENFLNISSLAQIHAGPEDEWDPNDRLHELQRRNTLCPPHLQSSYPVELANTPNEKKYYRLNKDEGEDSYAAPSRISKKRKADADDSSVSSHRPAPSGHTKRPTKMESPMRRIMNSTFKTPSSIKRLMRASKRIK